MIARYSSFSGPGGPNRPSKSPYIAQSNRPMRLARELSERPSRGFAMPSPFSQLNFWLLTRAKAARYWAGKGVFWVKVQQRFCTLWGKVNRRRSQEIYLLFMNPGALWVKVSMKQLINIFTKYLPSQVFLQPLPIF